MGMQKLYLAFQTAHDLMYSVQGLGLGVSWDKISSVGGFCFFTFPGLGLQREALAVWP